MYQSTTLGGNYIPVMYDSIEKGMFGDVNAVLSNFRLLYLDGLLSISSKKVVVSSLSIPLMVLNNWITYG